MRAAIAKLSKSFDWKDALLVAGVALVFYGLHMLLAASAYIALGVAFVCFALFAEHK